MTQSTLKVVGAFHGLSRDRSNARKYPAIDPLDSWSKYKSSVDEKQVIKGKAVLKRSNEIHQMMNVIGEEGTSLEDFIVYLKGEFIDSVYLQQNAYDEVDAATVIERQQHVFDLIHETITAEFEFKDKAEARKFFHVLIQKFHEWNSLEWQSNDFNEKEKEIKDAVSKKAKPKKENEEDI